MKLAKPKSFWLLTSTVGLSCSQLFPSSKRRVNRAEPSRRGHFDENLQVPPASIRITIQLLTYDIIVNLLLLGSRSWLFEYWVGLHILQ